MIEKKHIKEFSKHVNSYNSYTKVQQNVAKNLIKYIDKDDEIEKVLDLGCGTGEIYRLIGDRCKEFIAVDASLNMCEVHPKASNLKILCKDFEDVDLYNDLKNYTPFDLVISSSSLQWAKNLEKTFANICNISENFAFSIFTDGTFREIYNISGIKTFLPSVEKVLYLIKKFTEVEYKIEKRRVYFEDNISLFRYIKKSGVSGGEAKLSYLETKNLIKNYPLDYLEFEIIYLISL